MTKLEALKERLKHLQFKREGLNAAGDRMAMLGALEILLSERQHDLDEKIAVEEERQALAHMKECTRL